VQVCNLDSRILLYKVALIDDPYLIQLLLDAGANLGALDKNMCKPYDLAKEGSPTCLELETYLK